MFDLYFCPLKKITPFVRFRSKKIGRFYYDNEREESGINFSNKTPKFSGMTKI